jgi:hypothetical protein
MAKKNAWLTGDSLIGSTSRVLVIPGDLTMVMAVTGALEPLTHEYNWEKFGTIEPADAAYAMRLMLLDYLQSELPVGYESEITLSPISMAVAIGNAVTANFTASVQRENIAYAQSPAITSQVLSTERFMAAGNWSYRITSVRTAGSGILKLIFNLPGPTPVVTITHDLYVAGANQLNQYQTGTFTLPDNSKYFIELATNGKNAASSSFSLFVSLMEFWRTS